MFQEHAVKLQCEPSTDKSNLIKTCVGFGCSTLAYYQPDAMARYSLLMGTVSDPY